MSKYVIIPFLLLTFISCRKDPTIVIPPAYKTMDLIHFKLEVPQAWTNTNLNGIDSYVGQINFSDSEHATFDLGWYSNSLNVDTTTHTITYTTIDGKSAKIVQAINPENGTTGVYFASLVVGSMDKFNLYASNISALNQQALLAAIETLDFVQ